MLGQIEAVEHKKRTGVDLDRVNDNRLSADTIGLDDGQRSVSINGESEVGIEGHR